MSKKNKWKYKRYLEAGTCPKCGLPGYLTLGTIMGTDCIKVDHRIAFYRKFFTFKTCYPSNRNIWDPPRWYPTEFFTKIEAEMYRKGLPLS